jgi:hypothetical protein
MRRRKVCPLVVFCAIATGFVGLAPCPGAADLSEREYTQGQVILVLRENVPIPSEVTSLIRPRLGIASVDSVMDRRDARKLRGLLKSRSHLRTNSARRLARTFLLTYDDGTDARVVAAELASCRQVEKAMVNSILRKVYHGPTKFLPGSDTRFEDQWYLHSDHDRQDIGNSSPCPVTQTRVIRGIS